jgi:hypothetical protein
LTRPNTLLLHGLMEDLQPRILELRALGWPAEVRIDVDPDHPQMKVVVTIDLGGMPVPIEAKEEKPK